MAKKRVQLVDDNAVVRRGTPPFRLPLRLRSLWRSRKRAWAVEKAERLKPDLIVLDLAMPVMNGLEAAPLLRRVLPDVWLILFTAHDGPEVNRLRRC
jgi:CheY-like chemotaxis protein